MHSTAHIIPSFGLVYGSPKQSDVIRCVQISINNINFTFVVDTLKNLVFPFSNMETGRASLGSVARFYDNQFDTIQSRFVSKERTQLTERPTIKFGSKLFVSPFGSKADIGQILNGNTFTLFFSRIYNAFRNSVIDYGSRCSFLARKPFQQLTRAACAFALNRTANLLSFLSVLVNPISRVFGIIRSRNNVCQTEVYTDKFLDVINILFGNINGLKKVELAFLVNQICFTFNVGQIIRIVANKLNLLATTNTPQRNDITRLISHNTTVVSNTSKRSKSAFCFLIKFVGIGNFCNSTYQALRRKFKRFPISVVNFVMEFEIIKDAFRPSNVRNSITNCICFLDSFKEQIRLFSSWKKFDFQRQFHNTNVVKFSDIRKMFNLGNAKAGAFLPTTLGDSWVSCVNIL